MSADALTTILDAAMAAIAALMVCGSTLLAIVLLELRAIHDARDRARRVLGDD